MHNRFTGTTVDKQTSHRAEILQRWLVDLGRLGVDTSSLAPVTAYLARIDEVNGWRSPLGADLEQRRIAISYAVREGSLTIDEAVAQTRDALSLAHTEEAVRSMLEGAATQATTAAWDVFAANTPQLRDQLAKAISVLVGDVEKLQPTLDDVYSAQEAMKRGTEAAQAWSVALGYQQRWEDIHALLRQWRDLAWIDQDGASRKGYDHTETMWGDLTVAAPRAVDYQTRGARRTVEPLRIWLDRMATSRPGLYAMADVDRHIAAWEAWDQARRTQAADRAIAKGALIR